MPGYAEYARHRDGDNDDDVDLPRSIPITAPLTFSSVDWNRANAGTALLRRTPERAATEVARGSFMIKLADSSRAAKACDWRWTYSSGKP